MMNYWINVHWPPYKDEDEDAIWTDWLFLAEDYEQLGKKVKPGDLAFIYETLKAPRRKIDGHFVGLKRRGQQGIVALVEVTDSFKPDPGARRENYEDGRHICWRFRAKTKRLKPEKAFLHHKQVCKILKYSDKYYFRIRGGLRPLKEAQFSALRRQFK